MKTILDSGRGVGTRPWVVTRTNMVTERHNMARWCLRILPDPQARVQSIQLLVFQSASAVYNRAECNHSLRMTTFAARLGALPLTWAPGQVRRIRRPLGISIVGGLIVSPMNHTASTYTLSDTRHGSRNGTLRRLRPNCRSGPERTEIFRLPESVL